MSVKDVTERAANNDSSLVKVEFENLKAMTPDQVSDLAKALATNTHVTDVILDNKEMNAAGCDAIIAMLETNTTITNLDLGYNNINGDAIARLGQALAKNTSLREVKIHRQAKDYGSANEVELVKLWKTNTTLIRLYATLHDRTCNRTNTAAEVRNKEIARRIKDGKNWDDLNPDPEVTKRYMEEQAAKKAAAAEAEAAANAPISAKVESTGGPYTLKQLTCAPEFRPDDVDPKNREALLEDGEFQEVFKMDKTAFAALPKWKQAAAKKKANLH